MVGELMLKTSYNAIVRHAQATTAEEISEFLAGLPKSVASGLAAELEVAGDVHRYDADAQRAWYFERAESVLTAWSWEDVRRPHEAGELIFLVVSSTIPLDAKLACEFYARATGRSAERPVADPSQP
jgi:hypothetical protein